MARNDAERMDYAYADGGHLGSDRHTLTPPEGLFSSLTVPPCKVATSRTNVSPNPELRFPVSGRLRE
jgi:hypothetical protein